MSRASSESGWQAQTERGSPLGMAIVVWTALRCGRGPVRILLAGIVFYYTLFSPAARRASRSFLARTQSTPVTFWQIYRHFFCFAQVTVDRLFFLSGRNGDFDVVVHGNSAIDAHIRSGRGCLLLMSHLGSFDVLRAAGRDRKDTRARVLMDRDHAKKAMALLQAVNPDMAQDIIDVEQPPAQLMLCLQEALTSGQFVGVMADRVHRSERVYRQAFMGSTVQLPEGLWQMAAALKIPVVAGFGIYQGSRAGKARYDIFFHAIADSTEVERKERKEWMQSAQRVYVDTLESMAQAYPYNWFNFYDYWKLDES
ncbi:hypothetical protein WKI13_06445 [Teredinibacter turnerae]|uniref:LpxL/LpxP family acyltransferase n=1 Tax=Teredinibacter turnerae TaxID=2426 RepID=UPI0003A251E4|nr:hypothetical protein [Teredinibacter turnerae]